MGFGFWDLKLKTKNQILSFLIIRINKTVVFKMRQLLSLPENIARLDQIVAGRVQIDQGHPSGLRPDRLFNIFQYIHHDRTGERIEEIKVVILFERLEFGYIATFNSNIPDIERPEVAVRYLDQVRVDFHANYFCKGKLGQGNEDPALATAEINDGVIGSDIETGHDLVKFQAARVRVVVSTLGIRLRRVVLEIDVSHGDPQANHEFTPVTLA